MADEELVPEGGEALELEQQEAPQDDTPEPIANLAKELGWVPKEEFRGEPEKWKPADQFIRDGRDIQQTTARELRSVREQIERLGGVTETIIADKVAERDAYWQQQFNQAVEDGDTVKAKQLADNRPATDPPPKGKVADPAVEDWKSKNPWFEKDHLATIRAEEISQRLRHLPVADQLAEVDRAIRKEFPELGPKPAKPPPATQTGQSRNPNPSNRAKGFADMPLASQQVALDYEKRLGVPKEQTAKSYWAEQEGVKR